MFSKHEYILIWYMWSLFDHNNQWPLYGPWLWLRLKSFKMSITVTMTNMDLLCVYQCNLCSWMVFIFRNSRCNNMFIIAGKWDSDLFWHWDKEITSFELWLEFFFVRFCSVECWVPYLAFIIPNTEGIIKHGNHHN